MTDSTLICDQRGCYVKNPWDYFHSALLWSQLSLTSGKGGRPLKDLSGCYYYCTNHRLTIKYYTTGAGSLLKIIHQVRHNAIIYVVNSW